jgi:hypothetical protein
MSYIKPKQYYQIAEQMAEAYSRLRDALNDGTALVSVDQSSWTSISDIDTDYSTATTNMNDFAINIVKQVVEEEDDDSDEDTSIVHDITRDPPGSIANDLGAKFSSLATSFTEAKAKKIASSYFSTALKALNSHVLARTPLPPTASYPEGGVKTLNSINEYYEAYNDDPRSYGAETGSEMGLFTWQAGADDYFTGGYFSDNFVELCSQLSITINDQFKNSTWA